MKKNNKKHIASNILIILLVLIILASISIGLYSWAKYQTTIKGTATGETAKWSFKVIDGNTTTQNIDFPITRTDTNSSVVTGKLAPGTYGELKIGIDATGTETALTYIIEATMENKPTNLKFYRNVEKTWEIPVKDNKLVINGCINLSDAKVREQKIYWDWPLETGRTKEEVDANDKLDSNSMGNTMVMNVAVTGTQEMEAPLIGKITPTNYGDSVNYTVNVDGVSEPLDNWKIFYNDGSNVYIIYGDYLPNSAIKTDSITKDGNLRGYWKTENIGGVSNKLYAIDTITNTENWKHLLTDELKAKGATATGSPTLDMWVASWNEKGYTTVYKKYNREISDGIYEGYYVGKSEDSLTDRVGCVPKEEEDLFYPYDADFMDNEQYCKGYWLASPSYVNEYCLIVCLTNGHLLYRMGYNYLYYGFRPVICLPASMLGDKVDNVWQLAE
ncbi:MAG: hypothetical protein E7313_05615 [Clostridiales bacterium]|nr:hypothetical protein [Clostridiales bacterium]